MTEPVSLDPDRPLEPVGPQRAYALICSALVELFRLDPARITPEARLVDDLEIDSIDAVDLIEQVKRTTGRKVSAEDFKAVRTVADLARIAERLLSA
ncbi:MAG: acyl carrier protein [Steroidobacteraceae bacterium]